MPLSMRRQYYHANPASLDVAAWRAVLPLHIGEEEMALVK